MAASRRGVEAPPAPPPAQPEPSSIATLLDIVKNLAGERVEVLKDTAVQLAVTAIENSPQFKEKLDERILAEMKKRRIRPKSWQATVVRKVAASKARTLVAERLNLAFDNPSEFAARVQTGTLFEEGDLPTLPQTGLPTNPQAPAGP